MKTTRFLIPALFTLAAGFAYADDEYKSFDEADLNNDGELSMQEVRAAMPGLHQLLTSGGTGATGGAAEADATLTREQVSRVLPVIEFDEDRGPVTEDDYDKIVEELEERGISATVSRSSPAGATGAANQSSRGAAQSSANSNSPRTTGTSPSQEAPVGVGVPGRGVNNPSGVPADEELDPATRAPGDRPLN
jgi:hypothetical protein